MALGDLAATPGVLNDIPLLALQLTSLKRDLA